MSFSFAAEGGFQRAPFQSRKGPDAMQKLLAALIVVSLTSTFVVAQQSNRQSAKPKPTELRPNKKSNPCAQYGPGFVQVGDTTTCIKIGAGVTFEGTRSLGTR
jgi:hypothetical protein